MSPDYHQFSKAGSYCCLLPKFLCHVRLKRAGAWWYAVNSTHMLALRCAKYNGTCERVFERYRQIMLAKSQQKNVKK
jgi:hypothetical protein